MASKVGWGCRRPLELWLLAILAALLAVTAIELLVVWRLYATALVVAAGAVLAGHALWWRMTAADRELATLVESLTAGRFDDSARDSPGYRRLGKALTLAYRTGRDRELERERRGEHLQALVDNVAAALFVLDAEGRLTPANRPAQRLAGQAVYRLRDIDALDEAAAVALERLKAGTRRIVRLRDGRQMLAAAAQLTTPGKPPQRLLSLQDLAIDLGEVEVKAWQDLVRVLAHEIMNSLTPISSLAESVADGLKRSAAAGEAPSAELAGAMDVIARRSGSLMDFVDRYRRVAEPLRPEICTVLVRELIDHVAGVIGPRLQAEGVLLRQRTVPLNIRAEFDPALVEQALINLLLNALDAVRGAPDPTITLEARGEGDLLELRVADNGSGLTPDVASNAFIPFYTTKSGGSGIGLSVARQIALAHHGALSGRTLLKAGALFTLSLPLNADVPQAPV